MGDVLTLDIPDILSFWGKAQPSHGATKSWHPVVYHLLDVAAVSRPRFVRSRRVRGTATAYTCGCVSETGGPERQER